MSQRSRKQHRLLEVALFGAWLASLAVAFWIKNSQLLLGLDGGYMRELVRRQFASPPSPFRLSLDMLQGIGDITFGAFNFTLFPSFLVSAPLGESIAAKVVVYCWIAVELVAATYFLTRCLGLSRVYAIAAALTTCLLIFPFHHRGLLYPIASLTPHLFSVVAASMVAVGCYWKFGQWGWRADWPLGLVAFLILVYLFFAGAAALVLAVPFMMVCGVAGLLGAADRRERWSKLGLVGTALAIFIAAGPAAYMAGILLNASAVLFPTELINNRTGFEFASILFHWRPYGPAGPILVVLAMLGAVTTLWNKERRLLRALAIVMVTYFLTRISFWVVTVLFDFYRGPSALYFEFFVVPLYVVFAMAFLGHAWRLVVRVRLPRFTPYAPAALVFAFGALAIGFASTTRNSSGGFEYPPKSTPFVETIARLNAESPAYPGRTAVLTGQTLGDTVGWHMLVMNDLQIFRQFGNEMRIVGLQHFGVPALSEHGSTTTPAFYLLTSRTLTLPTDPQLRSGEVWRRFNVKILTMLGVRFAITDAPFDGPTLLDTMAAGKFTLYLYELPNPNLGTYSPTTVVVAPTVDQALSAVSADAFDPLAEVVAFEPLGDSGLVPATEARFSLKGQRFHIRAASTGRSVLVLPLSYTSCLVLSGGTDARLFRANLAETGVVFSGTLDATIDFAFGPFTNPWCRLGDLFEMIGKGAPSVGKGP